MIDELKYTISGLAIVYTGFCLFTGTDFLADRTFVDNPSKLVEQIEDTLPHFHSGLEAFFRYVAPSGITAFVTKGFVDWIR